MGKTQIGSSTISKKMFGNSEVVKEVLNGATVYEKGSGGGFSGVLTNTGYMQPVYFIDRQPTSDPFDYDGVAYANEPVNISCQSYVIIAYMYYMEYSVNSYSGCSYEEIQILDYNGYKIYPTQDGWTFSADFVD